MYESRENTLEKCGPNIMKGRRFFYTTFLVKKQKKKFYICNNFIFVIYLTVIKAVLMKILIPKSLFKDVFS